MRKSLVIIFLITSILSSEKSTAQIWFTTTGENQLANQNTRVREGDHWVYKRLTFTEKRVTITRQREGDILIETFSVQAPTEIKVVSANFKANDPSRILMLLSTGSTVVLRNTSGNTWQQESYVPNTALANGSKIVGDAVYVLRQGKVYASRDTAKTWQIDSTNIGAEYVQDVTVDTSFYAWAITQSRNLYRQHPDSNIWRKNTSFVAASFPQSIFVDRKGRIFISTSSSTERVWMSTNGGSTWTNSSTGITETISRFGDDAFGNIYAVGSGSNAYRLSNLTLPWTSIADSLNALSYLPSSAKIVNSISGDTTLYAATRYGMYQSTDFGANWVRSTEPGQSKSHLFYAPVIRGGNFYFVSNSLGIFREAVGDTTWQKVWPKQGYIWGVNAISSDSAGNVYANIPLKTSPTTSVFWIVKSTDQGNTWNPDTVGLGKLGVNAGTQSMNFSVDRQGTEFLVATGKLYSKRPGQSWKIDTTGLGLLPGEVLNDIGTNHKKGIIYVARVYFTTVLKFGIYTRAFADTAWKIVDTSPLAVNQGRMVSDQNGDIVVKTFTTPYKLWRYDGTTWTQATIPSALGLPLTFTVDRDGVLWGVFQSGAGANLGVYFSTNSGTNWTYVGLNGVGVNFLSAVDNPTTPPMGKSATSTSTVYAVTFIDGIYGFTTATIPVSVSERRLQIAASYELYQNYPNPFNPSTYITFTLPNRSMVTLKIYDLLGREVTALLNEERGAGIHTVHFDAAKLSTGVYIYTMRAGNFAASKKLLLMK